MHIHITGMCVCVARPGSWQLPFLISDCRSARASGEDQRWEVTERMRQSVVQNDAAPTTALNSLKHFVVLHSEAESFC